MILQRCHLGEATAAELTVKGFLASVRPHVPLQYKTVLVMAGGINSLLTWRQEALKKPLPQS